MEKKRKGANAREAGFCVCGGDFAVDFVNTRVCVRGVRVELLHSLEDVAAWLERAGKREALTDGIDTLAPDKRREVYLRIMELRDRMEEVFAAMVKGEDLPGGFVDYLNGQLESYAGHDRLVRQGTSWAVERRYPAAHLPALFLEETARFVASMDPKRLKACENKACILYFYDTSRNRQRRWCSMDTCGNRMKASRHYHRRKAHRPL
ncbi:MAG TPA: CGNR zinc finger domain-containing protein [Paenibacillaceae bacterium]